MPGVLFSTRGVMVVVMFPRGREHGSFCSPRRGVKVVVFSHAREVVALVFFSNKRLEE